MKFYLSSYKLGNQSETLKRLAKNRKIAFIPNALDYVKPEARKESNLKNIKDLTDLGFEVEMLDLQNYFGKKNELEKKFAEFQGVWVRGGNTFVLLQAMKLSGFDEIIKNKINDDFLYGGYSAGICVLGPTLKGLTIVDDPAQKPYGDYETVWDGLNILDYLILPHYQSDHPESADIDKEVEFCKSQNIPFKTLSDGEVIIIE